MCYTGKVNQSTQMIITQAELLQALANTEREFSRVELTRIINNQFFNNRLSLNADLVDAAIARILLLDGVTLDEASLQRERERMIYGVLSKILKPRT